MKPTQKELMIKKVTQALLGDIDPPLMTAPMALASEDVWVTLESGETLKAYFHSNGYCYSRGIPQRPDGGVFRWKREATITKGGGGSDREWRDERPWVVSWSTESPVAHPMGSRGRFRLFQQT